MKESTNLLWFSAPPESYSVRFQAVIVPFKKVQRVRVDLVFPLEELPWTTGMRDRRHLHEVLVKLVAEALPGYQIAQWGAERIDMEYRPRPRN